MNLLGVYLTLRIGPTVPVPAPPWLLDALDEVVVQQRSKGPSGFQLTFKIGRQPPQLRTDMRVVLIVTFAGTVRVLMDGIISHQEHAPSNEPGTATLTVTGEDVSVVLGRKSRTLEHPAQDDALIVTKLILSYAQYGLVPLVVPPGLIDFPNPIERVPVQHCTDLEYVNKLAERYGYVFYVKAGPKPLTNTAYWGPPIRVGVPQKALSMNLGTETNVDSLSFQYDAEKATLVSGEVQDPDIGMTLPVQTFTSTRRPPFAIEPGLLFGLAQPREEKPGDVEGLTYAQAFARAQARTNASVDEVLTAEGELDAMRYGDALQARGVVGVRGAGFLYDGLYYVKDVTHTIRKGQYKQRFTLTREGLGSTTRVVRV